MRMIAIRLHKGLDLKASIESLVRKQKISAGCIMSAVGCLSHARLRMASATADDQDIRDYGEPLEIVSLMGNVSQERAHLHVAVSTQEGNVIGGHLKENCIV